MFKAQSWMGDRWTYPTAVNYRRRIGNDDECMYNEWEIEHPNGGIIGHLRLSAAMRIPGGKKAD